MKNIVKNLSLLAIGVISTLVFVEFTLYLSGRIYYVYRIENKAIRTEDKNTIKILCLGDSNTFGMGAQKGYSYPEQLEHILNKYNPDKNFIVYNGGIPGWTSSKLLRRLEENLCKYDPDILMVLIGANDTGCIEETNYFLLKNNGIKSFIYRFDYYLSQLRVYKLFKRGWDDLVVSRLKKRLFATFISSGALESLKSKSIIQSFTSDSERFEEFRKHVELGRRYYNAYDRKVSLAFGEFKKAISLMPVSEDGYLGMAGIYFDLNKFELAISELEKAMKINPYNKDISNRLWMAYYQIGKIELAQEALQKYLCLNPSDIRRYLSILRYGFPISEDKITFDKLLRYNLKKVIDITGNKKVKIILQNYPGQEQGLEWVQLVLEEVAIKNKVPLVNNRLIFNKLALMPGFKYADYFAEDTHCNSRGYFVMARNVYAVMKQERILE